MAQTQLSQKPAGEVETIARPERERLPLRVLFVTSATCEGPINQNHYQRLAILSRQTYLAILARRGGQFPMSENNGAEVISPRIPGRLGVFLQTLRMAWARKEYDVVITDPSVLGLCGAIWKRFGGGKWVVDVWDIPIRSARARGLTRIRTAATRQLIRRAYRRADHFIVSILPDLELNWFRIPAGKISAFANAIWRDRERPSEAATTAGGSSREILCMRSRYSADGGLDTLGEAFKILRRDYPDARLTVVGYIPDEVRPQLTEVADLPGVELIDQLEHNTLLRRITAAAVCVIPFKDVPDLAQTYPIKVLEYLSLGRPVVASNIRGLAHLIDDGRNGLLFRAGDAADLAAKLSRLFADPALGLVLGENGRDLHSRHDAQVKGDEILNLLARLVRGYPSNCS